MPVVHSVKTMRQSDAEINTISIRTKVSFDLTHVTYEYHPVRSK
jgi:hypothetical protein